MKTRKVPMRRCAGCMESFPKKDLIRIVHDKEDRFLLDRSGKASGRGVYLCCREECFRKAKKKNALSRSLGVPVPKEDLDRLFEELSAYESESGQN